MRNILLVIGFLVVFPGCFHSMPGDIFASKSEFDGATEITMKPVWACSENGDKSIIFDPSWRSTMPKDTMGLTLWVKDNVVFSSTDPARFNIDGEIFALNSEEEMQFYYNPGMVGHGVYIAPWSKSGKRFMVNKKFIEKILAAQRVVIRIDLQHGYKEATFSSPTQSNQDAKEFMQKFYEKVFLAQ